VPVPVPMGVRPRISGKLKVVEPFPEPYVIPIIANKAEYVALDTAEPSHESHPLGAVVEGYMIKQPGGIMLNPVSVILAAVIFAAVIFPPTLKSSEQLIFPTTSKLYFGVIVFIPTAFSVLSMNKVLFTTTSLGRYAFISYCLEFIYE
jgi:hypothetical protein